MRRTLVLLAVLAVLLIGGLTVRELLDARSRGVSAARDSVEESLEVVEPVPAPAPREQGFVGSGACYHCHTDISESFAGHPMGRDAHRVPEEPADYAVTDEVRLGRRVYRVERREDRVLHHEVMLDEAGEVIYDQSEEVTWAIGSGQHGIGYVLERDGALFQSPISWDAERGHWRLSPGYEGSSELRFERRLTEVCLLCHSGRLVPSPQSSDCFLPPVFAELTIGCERCHGPGERHVALQESLGAAVPDATIVNPARLEFAARDAVCYQCHLHGLRFPRHGRTLYDFRPGDRLEDTLTVLVDDFPPTEDALREADHVLQMRSSRCYTASGGALGCVTCHDPHFRPEPEQAADYFRQRCLECHADRGCALPVERRESAADSCVHCHMPNLPRRDMAHAASTDHRLLRAPGEQGGEAGGASHSLVFFDAADEKLPDWETARLRGIALSLFPDRRVAGLTRASTLELLQKAIRHAPDDVAVLQALGVVDSQRNQTRQAVAYWERALEIDPYHERILRSLVLACTHLKDYERAEEYQLRLLEIVPRTALNLAQLCEVRRLRGNLDGAAEAGESALALDPTLVHLRRTLIGIYEQLGQPSVAERHRETSQRIEGTGPE